MAAKESRTVRMALPANAWRLARLIDEFVEGWPPPDSGSSQPQASIAASQTNKPSSMKPPLLQRIETWQFATPEARIGLKHLYPSI
ncbi:MAG: hypothetical protein ACRECZ_06245 [Methylocella sp.]